MRILNLKIRNYRGIRFLDWNIVGRLSCLIGPGDSTKTTILEAIEVALTARRIVTFDDSDFYAAETNQPVLIEVTVGNVPKDLLSLDKYGYLIRGYSESREIRDEPDLHDEPVLTIRLSVDASLEPSWNVVNDRQPEGKRISAFDRAKFGVARIGNYLDSQLTWGQGTALTRLMEDKEDVRSILSDARRNAKNSLDSSSIPLLTQSANKAETIGKRLGVSKRSEEGFIPHLDIRNLSITAGILALHDGKIPLRQSGLGSTRLLTMGLQHEASHIGGITLIDEIEHGLEPHRLRRALQILMTDERLGDEANERPSDTITAVVASRNHILLTTHSSIAISELEPDHLAVVRSEKGTTSIRHPALSIRPLLRTNPEAFLARKIIVCEGKTEIGFCRALDGHWSKDGQCFAYVGAAIANGQGNSTGQKYAIEFANLGYQTAFFGDSDEPIDPDESTLQKAGVRTILWEGGVSIEERFALDVPLSCLLDNILQVIEYRGEDHVKSKLMTELKCSLSDLDGAPTDWIAVKTDEAAFRKAFGKAAKSKKAEWFKRVDLAEKLGETMLKHWGHVKGTPTGNGISKLKAWIYD